ncbi:MAG: DUF1003 domain-containing protein [Bryobacteraceae bacterium]
MQPDSTTNRNIQAICEMEKQALESRTLSARIGDAIATHAGRMWFIAAHMVWFAIWIALNIDPHGRAAFDPYPFSLLTMIVSLESIFLSLFILMSQNRSGLQAEQRNHLDLQINLLAEDENTKILQMLQALCEHHNLAIGNDPEIQVMTRRTEVGEVISDLQKNLPIPE